MQENQIHPIQKPATRLAPSRYRSPVLLPLLLSTLSALWSQLSFATDVYPATFDERIRIQSEDYQPSYRSLKNLQGLYVNTAPIEGFYSRLRLGKATDLIGDLRKRVEQAGLRWLDKESVEQEPGQPTLNFFPSYKPGCCTLGLWAGFSQGAKVLSAPDENFRLSSWGSGANHYGGEKGASCLEPAQWAYENIVDKLEAFLADVERAKEAETPAPIPAATTANRCSTEPMLYVEMFDTGDAALGEKQRNLLNELASTIAGCPQYDYRIEAHADQRGSTLYNLGLSQARAQAIQTYLIASGIKKSRFESLGHGENRLVSAGTTDAELAANRRVVVTPIRTTDLKSTPPPLSVFRLLPNAQVPRGTVAPQASSDR